MISSKILVIEDDKRIREMIKEYLENSDYEVIEAADGNEGLEKLSIDDYSIVLLDVMLPTIDGWSVLREIRKKSEVPVIMVTARGEEYDKLFGFDLGADDYIVKPFSPKELLARIKAIIKRSRKVLGLSSEGQIFIYKDLKVNFESRKVNISEISVDMTPKEFDLLAFLIQNPEKVFTREQLLDKVWGYEFAGELRTVDTHVKMLRESLKHYRNLIVTVWGVGYKFEIGG